MTRTRGKQNDHAKGSIGQWLWICPLENCRACSLRLQSFGKAGRYGRMHLKRKHKDLETQPIIKKIEGEKK